jgi:NADH-quinone oxidoreductase subunit E/NADP-reducing hydrogenase subunit HndA
MSDAFTTNGASEPSGFFGAEQAQITEDLDPAIWSEIDDFLANNPGGQERLIPLLHMVQESVGYLPFATQEYIADKLGLSPAQVYGVVSFYNFFTTTPRGRYQFKVCMGTACYVRQAQRLVDALRVDLNVELGGLSEDGLFNLDQARCLGACGLAPAVMVNNRVHGELTRLKMQRLVRSLRSQSDKKPKDGPDGSGGEASR